MEDLADVRTDLDWLKPVSLSIEGVADAARGAAELHNRELIGALDTLIAERVREASGTLMTREGHFERVEGLDGLKYD